MKLPKKKAYRTVAAAERRFSDTYGVDASEATSAVQEAVIGADVGANGYTTVAQADILTDALGLSRGDALLDIGAGRGWPGLHIAKRTGCDVVLTDLPAVALLEAAARARHNQLQKRAACVVAGASALPFRPRSFDAIVHSDVLC